jgi:hypothetical protein
MSEVPTGPTMPCCDRHADRGQLAEECVACQAERYEAALRRLASPDSALTLKGVLQVAQEALRRVP